MPDHQTALDWDRPAPVQITCAKGVPALLEQELAQLGVTGGEAGPVSLEVQASLNECMAFNLKLRTAHRVLYRLDARPCRDLDELYAFVVDLPWEGILDPDGYFTVGSFVRIDSIRDGRVASLRTKDAVADRMRDACGRRPDSGSGRHGAALWLYWAEDQAAVFLDTSGESLSRRGYRKQPLDAPMQETLAAAALLDTGWDGTTPLINPMCGSGTIAIEGALMARRIAPGSLGRGFAFQHLQGYSADAWKTLVGKAGEDVRGAPPIVATDIRPQAQRATLANARGAGILDDLKIEVCDFRETPLPGEGGIVFFNPEYGHRMGVDRDLTSEYRAVGDFLKQRCAGRTGVVFTGNIRMSKQVGLRPLSKRTLFSGELECRLLQFELFA